LSNHPAGDDATDLPVCRALVTKSEDSMYQKNPIDQVRERTAKGGQPVVDAKEALRQSEADLRRKAAPDEDFDTPEGEEERIARQEAEAAERLAQIGENVAKHPGTH
jgi:hypothetical protein